MSKYFSDIKLMDRDPKFGPKNEFKFTMKNVNISNTIANAIRRIAGLNIKTFTISGKSINFIKNTSSSHTEMITHELVYIPLKSKLLSTLDLNMLELSLNVKNIEKNFKYIISNELKLQNKETKQTIPIDDIILYDNLPLFLLGFDEEINLTCGFEYKSKNETNAVHQAATLGIDFETDKKNPFQFPKEILFTANLQSDFEPKELISNSFDNLIQRLQSIQKAIKDSDTNLFYLQLNKHYRYDFVFIGEDDTLGSLIEKWNNHNDIDSITAYRVTRDGKTINVEYGLRKFLPEIARKDFTDENSIEGILEKSITGIDEKKEKKQRTETIDVFIENISRLEKYIIELKQDWDKVKTNVISLEKYMDEVQQERQERTKRINEE